jgi:sulfate/thiosulfate transport system ATP-binding protein
LRLALKQLTKRFDETLVLDRVDLEIREHEFLGLLGPSGSGKTTMLRILAGLEVADSGEFSINDQDAFALPLKARQMGFVFQHYALFEHMSVFENVAFGLRVRPRSKRPKRSEIKERVQKLLELVQLTGFEDRFPAQLSGGQRQRVALARALAIEPKVLLLDEPFGALDAKVRVELRRSLREIHDAAGLTTVFVTHDQEEALDLADRVAIMTGGRIEQVGTPAEIYEAPRSPFVFDFLGRTNSFSCEVENGKAKLGDKLLEVDPPVPDGPAVAFVRPANVVLSKANGPVQSEDPVLPGAAIVRFISALGPWASVELLYERQFIEVEMVREKLGELDLSVGDKCTISVRFPKVFARRKAERQVADTGKRRRSRLRFRSRQRNEAR